MRQKKQNMDQTDIKFDKCRPARSDEQRELQCIALAYDLVEQRLRNGTATSQETTHFLKLGSSMAKLEQIEKAKDIELKTAKTEAIQASQKSEALFQDAIKAMRKYSGQGVEDEEE